MFIEFFENLRNKPREERKRFAFLFTSVCTFFIVFIWITALILNGYGARGVNNDVSTSEGDKKEEVPTATLFKDANSFTNDANGGEDFSSATWEEELKQLDKKAQEEAIMQTAPEVASSSTSTKAENTHATVTKSIF